MLLIGSEHSTELEMFTYEQLCLLQLWKEYLGHSFFLSEFIKAKAIWQVIQAGKLFIMAIYEEIPIKY